MKNIAICFDGTWNTSDAPYPTNVVLTARLLTPTDERGNPQVIFYDAGVGSERVAFAASINNLLGGAFGAGLLNNIEHAYRALIFNYAPGDKIFIFGFSRGAFSARSLGGLIRKCGILRKEHVHRVGEAIALYRNTKGEQGHPDNEEFMRFRNEYSVPAWNSTKEHGWRKRLFGSRADHEMPLQIEYMGIWDTVGAMGVPANVAFADLFNRRYRFHDSALSSMVRNGRHAVAIDERRRIFKATLWENVKQLNADAAMEASSGLRLQPPYLQQWFPGDHGSVGGGGDVVGLSDEALVWVLDGAVRLGLGVDLDKLGERRHNADYRAPLHNIKQPAFGIVAFLMSLLPRGRRKELWEVEAAQLSESACKRLVETAENLPGRRLYRPRPLRRIADGMTSKAGMDAVKSAA
jgi:uncharacterized protein (DUF2235 family)